MKYLVFLVDGRTDSFDKARLTCYVTWLGQMVKTHKPQAQIFWSMAVSPKKATNKYVQTTDTLLFIFRFSGIYFFLLLCLKKKGVVVGSMALITLMLQIFRFIHLHQQNWRCLVITGHFLDGSNLLTLPKLVDNRAFWRSSCVCIVIFWFEIAKTICLVAAFSTPEIPLLVSECCWIKGWCWWLYIYMCVYREGESTETTWRTMALSTDRKRGDYQNHLQEAFGQDNDLFFWIIWLVTL